MKEPTDLDRVCLVIDLEGFPVGPSRGKEKRFLVREMGWCAWPGYASDVGSHSYFILENTHSLTLNDRRTIRYVTTHIHGMTYTPAPEEHSRAPWQLYDDIRNLYNTHRTSDRQLVAYKGGHIERDILQKMGIPSLDLESWGCPKFDQLPRLITVSGCGHHADPLRHHCPRTECYHFMQWMRRTMGLPRDINFVNLERASRLNL